MAEWYAIATGVQVGSALLAGSAQADTLERQAALARIQGKISLAQAQFASRMQIKAGREQANYLRRESARRVGEAVASVADAGVELSGSPALAIGEQVRRDEMSAAQVITNARVRASMEEARGRGAAVSAELAHDAALEKAGITRTAGYLDAIGAGLAGAAHYYNLTGGDASLVNDSGYSDTGPWSGY